MRIVFMGTPDFAIPVLAALLDASHDVVGVYTQPDRRRGRGRRSASPAVKTFAEELHLRVFQPESLRDQSALDELRGLEPDLIVIAAYGLLLPLDVLKIPRFRTLNVHPSLLPKYRGASPVSAAILDGNETTGVTIMVVDEGLDSGPIVAQEETAIGSDDDAETLTKRLFEMGGNLLAWVLPRWERGKLEPIPQDESQATVTRRLSRDDGRIDWSRPAGYLARQIRAYQPWPGSFTQWDGRIVKVVKASTMAGEMTVPPGEVVVVDDGLAAGTGEGLLVLETVQLEGRQAMETGEFLRGHPGFIRARLE